MAFERWIVIAVAWLAPWHACMLVYEGFVGPCAYVDIVSSALVQALVVSYVDLHNLHGFFTQSVCLLVVIARL
jgi:hypothetical protein